ncbi:Septal ring factor EnvC, activator of murein hydrolases AmiA and AmiB [Jannaschia faecimaris]|uniref:Septal ring factor EnvC, activator of murein hydrolases AmiA and AmiB n=1 Tax=Jannaschia faecimaris TaxID=1244108 RepID=A0A1H3J6S2_9RHOB|nr:peptidoglycan DD-metalloendopeptidase family protein [Jannaschia faecimaris]SDY34884.1 Septal ring factor EnvC, activator of murein hydrolases AmiA and AmiB [Jannaschia faecimaris]
MIRLAALLLMLAMPAQAQSAAETAQAAAEQLSRAARQLEQAQGAGDRVDALTEIVQAYEGGLSALRDGLRQLAIRERALTADLTAREADTGRLVAALQAMERAPVPLLLMHPSGPLGTARSSMMLSDVAPALNARAKVLRDDLAALRDLRVLEQSAADSLALGLTGVQEARVALSEAIAERTDLPPRLSEDSARIAALLGRVDTLEAFALGLGALPPKESNEMDLPLPLPVAGRVLRRFNEPDAAEIRRPGLVLATSAAAVVTAPVAGTVRYSGPLLDYGNVIILEPRPDTLLVFAGLSEVYARQTEILRLGAPLGLMGGRLPDGTENLRESVMGGGALRPETLYIEVRQGGTPEDPANWFATE